MPDLSLRNRTNIFGTTSATNGTNFGTFEWPADVTADDMFRFLKFTSDQYLEYMKASADWLGTAAQQGQNTEPDGLVLNPHKKPTRLTPSYLSAQNWGSLVQFPTLPSLPPLPDAFNLDFARITADFTASLANLENSWMTSYLPASPTEVDALNSMLDHVLDGTYYDSSQQKMNALETELKAALTTAVESIKTSMTSSISALDATLSSRTSQIDSKLAAQLAIATDNTQNIAWSRARDQAVAEAVRAEADAAALWASRGFPLPPGALAMQALSAAQTTTNASVRIAAEEALKSQSLYFDVAAKGVDAWLSATQLVVGTDLENYKNAYAQRLAVMQAETEQNRAKVKQAFDHIGLSLDFSKFAGDVAMRYRLGVSQAIASLVSAYSQFFRDQTGYAAAKAAAMQTFYGSVIDYYRAALQSADLSIKGEFNNTANDLRFAEISANFINQAVAHHVQAAVNTGNMYAQAASYALNGMSGIATKAAPDPTA